MITIQSLLNRTIPNLMSFDANFTEQLDLHLEEPNEIPPPDNLLLFTIIWPLIALVGIVANLIVIFVMCFSIKLTSATQYFIINLAVSDIIFLTVCPTLVIINVHKLIHYDELPKIVAILMCKADYFSSHMAVFITCLTLMSMTFDRYLVIMHPLKSLSFRTTSKAFFLNICIWIISLLLSAPHGYYRVLETHNNESICVNSLDLDDITLNFYFAQLNLNQFNLLYTIIISYIIPFVTIVTCYLIMINKLTKERNNRLDFIVEKLIDATRKSHVKEAHQRRRILVMIAFVTILFGLSWLPIHCLHIAMKFFPNSFPFYSDTMYTFKNLAHTLTFMNSMLNPFFYTIMGANFRKQVFAPRNNQKYLSRLKAYYSRGSANINFNNANCNAKSSIRSVHRQRFQRVDSNKSNIQVDHQSSRKSSNNNHRDSMTTYKF